jgi:hypothetical protein
MVMCVQVKEQVNQHIEDNYRIGLDESASKVSMQHGINRSKNG